jgi:hypothetical protein
MRELAYRQWYFNIQLVYKKQQLFAPARFFDKFHNNNLRWLDPPFADPSHLMHWFSRILYSEAPFL